jgi:hypothetical protein
MKPSCIQAVNAAIGRTLSNAEIKAIDDNLSRHMRQNAQKDPQGYLAKTADERAYEAARTALAELQAEKTKKDQRKVLQVIKTARAIDRVNAMQKPGKYKASALASFLEQVDMSLKGVARENFSSILGAIEAAEPRFFGLLGNPTAVRDFVKEVRGESTGNTIAAKGAKVWLDGIEKMRKRFNRGGGDVHKIDYGYLPQPHDSVKVHKMGKDEWVKTITPLLDRSRYLRDDGSRMSASELTALLEKAHETIASDGLNKMEPGKFMGNGMLANHGNEARQIHFKDADSYLAYMNELGRGSIFEAMQNHVGGISRDIALTEEMGPNPSHLFKQLNDMAIKADGGDKLVGPLLVRTQNMWDVMSGFTSQSVHQKLGNLGQGIRNYTVAAKLQGTILSSVTDIPTLMVTARYNNMPVFKTLGSVIKAFGKDSKMFANEVGLVSDSVISDMNRWAEGNLGQNWTAKLANTTMKVSLLNAWTDALKRGFSISMMSSLARTTKKDWGAMHVSDKARLEAKGITETDYAVWQLAKRENWKGQEMLTPESIHTIDDAALEAFGNPQRLRNTATSKLLGYITDESEFAVLTPDLMTKAALSRSTQKGTLEGEALRSFALFKSFPLGMISRHLRRAANTEAGMGGTAYAAQLMLGLTLFGALSLQLKDMASGKDPRDMTTKKAWLSAFMQGGGLGIFGDILYTGMGGQNRAGQANWGSLVGPIAGTVFDLANVTLGNIGEAAQGKETHAGAELLRFGRQNAPLVNLWYARAAIDHMFFHEAQEYFSPGYLNNLRSNTRKDFGQDYWWAPGETMPDRAPNLGAAVGDN